MTRSRRSRRIVGTLIGLAAALAIGAPVAIVAATSPGTPPVAQQATVMPSAAMTVLGGSPARIAAATSQALFTRASVVVLTDPASVALAGGASARLGAPALLVPDEGLDDAALVAELRRLSAATVVTVGVTANSWAVAHREAAGLRTVRSTLDPEPVAGAAASPRLEALTVVSLPSSRAAAATAAAAGAHVIELHGPDPRGDASDAAALTGRSLDHVLALGDGFGTPQGLRYRLAVAAGGAQLPGGGQLLFPGRHFVALYGHPGAPVLGVLGEQGIEASIARAQALAAEYQTAFGEPVIPTFEIIATIASAGAGADGDYSDETSVETLRPWVEAAQAAGVYVMLDLQPGRTDFLTQAKRYESLLAYPNVGLALDPEWRLGPDQFHLKNVGHVDAAEVNAVGAWLEALTEANLLPQKVFMIHQWLRSMIADRPSLVTDYDALAVVIHVDGFGGQGAKQQTWAAMRADAPAGVWWGWKNFIDEDRPMLTPEQTVAQVQPWPVFISYQ